MMARWRALTVAAALAGGAAAAQDGGAAADEPVPLRIRVGETVAICATGTIICPAGAALCDDPAVAVPDASGDGLSFRGVGEGTTLCSAQAAQGRGMRRVYRVIVAPRLP